MRKKLNSYTDRCNEYLSSELMYKNIRIGYKNEHNGLSFF